MKCKIAHWLRTGSCRALLTRLFEHTGGDWKEETLVVAVMGGYSSTHKEHETGGIGGRKRLLFPQGELDGVISLRDNRGAEGEKPRGWNGD